MELASESREIDLDRIADIEGRGSHEWQILAAAKMYTSMGFWILPLRKNSKIIPPKSYNLSYQHASNKTSTIEKWFGEEGKFQGWNIGIATGKEGGTFAVDVDRHGKSDGMAELQQLEGEYGEFPSTPIQETPRGGRHYLFAWQPNATSSTGKIAESIDTRGGTDNLCKGHIVVWPSVVDGKQYKWVRGGNKAQIPKWIMELMGVPWVSQQNGNGRGNENVTLDDIEQQIPLEQVHRMLKPINPNGLSYDDWLRIGMAIKSQHPGDDGLDLWNRWSSQGDRYEQDECHIRWKGLDQLGPVRMGTLFHFAKEAGWTPDPELNDKNSSKTKDLVHKMNKEYAIVMTGGKLKVLREKRGNYDPVFGHYELLDREAFRGMLEPFTREVVNSKGKLIHKGIADIWLGDQERRLYDYGMECCPDGKVRPGVYNTWSGFSCEPSERPIPVLFIAHVMNIICRGNIDHFNWLMDWCAFAIQKPGELPGTCVVMRGPEGTGKGTLADTMGMFFGPHYRHLIDNSHLLSNFNAHMIDACFVFADEITYGGEMKTAGKLKGMVTERYLVGERKGIDAVGYRNMIHLMIASNSDWVIPVGPNSRRWFILDVSNEMASNKEYFDKIANELNTGGREGLLHYLMTRNIKSNLRKAPETKALAEQASRTVSTYNTVVRWWTRKIINERLDSMDMVVYDPHGDDDQPNWPKVVKTSDLLSEYSIWCSDNKVRSVSDFVFYSDMRKFGLKPTRPAIGGVRIRALKIPTPIEATTIMAKLGHVTIDEGEDNDSDNN